MGRAATPKKGFGGVLRELRTEQGLTLEDVARQAKVTGSYLARIELGQMTPSTDVVERIAKALGVSVPALMEAGGRVPPQIAEAWQQTPEAMLWFASLSPAMRNRQAGQSNPDDERNERARIRAIAKRLSDP